MQKARESDQEVVFPTSEEMLVPTACGRGSAPADTDRVIRVGWRVVRDHHVVPGDAMLLHQAVRGAAGVVALACVVTAQHAEQASQALTVGRCQPHGSASGCEMENASIGTLNLSRALRWTLTKTSLMNGDMACVLLTTRLEAVV